MKENHITEILESTPLGNLSDSDVKTIRTHAQVCEPCRRAYAAATISTLVIKERVKQTIEPSPFFQTRLMAAWREQQATENVPAIFRLWKSAGALVSSMALATVALAALSFMAPATQTPLPQETASAYSAESVIFDQSNDDQMSYGQVLNTIYQDDEEAR
jgi:hypothetical protein